MISKEKKEIKTGVARIDTDTLISTSNDLGEVQKKALLYFISKIDHNKDYKGKNPVVVISFADLVNGFGTYGIKWKESKMKFNNFIDEIAGARINFFSEVEINGEKMKGFFNWFSGIKPIKQHGSPHYEVRFNSDVIDLIFNLKKFTRLYSNDFKNLKGKSTIDLFSILAANYGKQERFKEKVTVKYSIEELKLKLNIDSDEYSKTNNFKRRIIDYSIKQINKDTSIYVWCENVKEGRSTIGYKFYIVSNYYNKDKDSKPTLKEIGSLYLYQYEVYRILKDYGILPGIIIKQIIPKLPKGVIEGYEDLFIKACIIHFESNTNKKTLSERAGAFVQWFCYNKVYTEDTELIFIKLREFVISKIKTFSAKEHNKRSQNIGITMSERYGEQIILEI